MPATTGRNTLLKIKGNHTIKIGGQFQRATTKTRRDRARTGLQFLLLRILLLRDRLVPRPTRIYAPLNLAGASQTNHVAALNELLLGLTDDVARSFGVTNRHIFQNSLGLYVQDSWKVKPNFTLEVGRALGCCGRPG